MVPQLGVCASGVAGYRWYKVGNGILGRGTSWGGGRELSPEGEEEMWDITKIVL